MLKHAIRYIEVGIFPLETTIYCCVVNHSTREQLGSWLLYFFTSVPVYSLPVNLECTPVIRLRVGLPVVLNLT
jgi:hypothetical protein